MYVSVCVTECVSEGVVEEVALKLTGIDKENTRFKGDWTTQLGVLQCQTGSKCFRAFGLSCVCVLCR